jgi:N-acetylglucosaminyldiphosphoundecaprenol N-acetyl-beta-D-mannosaminyltransferase
MLGVYCENILGYSVVSDNINKCLSDITSTMIDDKSSQWLACINPHSYAVSLQDAKFSNALKSADWLVPDGIGIVYASWLLGGCIKQRITGFDIFSGINEYMNTCGNMSVFFLGASDETLEKICLRMSIEYKNINVVGTFSPPFKSSYCDEETDQMISIINKAKPDVLWVAMTAPKQEKWVYENLPMLNVRFAGAVGAVFDYYVGNVNRANPIFINFGLEWLPRLIQQPKRLWKRMFISAPVFMKDVVVEMIRCKFNGSS